MPSYIGFSTINANKPRSTNLPAGLAGGVGSMVQPVIPGKKYRLVDEALVIQDFINSLNIQQGQKVGNPSYGTTLWSFVFEPNTFDVQNQLETEIDFAHQMYLVQIHLMCKINWKLKLDELPIKILEC